MEQAILQVLKDRIDSTSFSHVARELGVSITLVNQVYHGKYASKSSPILERAVRTRYMLETVECPVLQTIGLGLCHQSQRIRPHAANPMRQRIYRACRDGCPHFLGEN